MRISKKNANHIVAKISGVKETDSRIEAAEKALATMKLAGFPPAAIRKVERMIADAKARGVL